MQLLAYDKIIPNIDASFEATRPEATYYNFFFENNELYIFYPLSTGCENGDFYIMNSYSYRYDTRQCIDENAEYSYIDLNVNFIIMIFKHLRLILLIIIIIQKEIRQY